MRKPSYLFLSIVAAVIFVCNVATLEAKPDVSVKYSITRAENKTGSKNTLILPYAFANESLGFTVGVGGAMKGYGQDQLLVGGTILGSSDEAALAALGIWDYMLPGSDRLYFSAIGSVGYYPRQRAYSYPFFSPGVTRPGSNDSSDDQYVQTPGIDNWVDFKLEYVLSLGSAENKGMLNFQLENGILQSEPSGGSDWNPMKNGVTVLMLKQYNRYQSYETEELGEIDGTVHPVQLGIYYDNTDFPSNPSSGSSQYFGYTHDFAWADSDQEWSFMEFEASKYYSLGSTEWSRQRIIALNLWTGHSPSWEEKTDNEGNIVADHRPPHFEGSVLGGFYRMRGFDSSRFNDRSVIYTSAEYRYTMQWNPLADISWLEWLQTDWVQLVAFIEGGRVANDYEFSELFSEWKADVGLAFRAMMAGGIIRLDIGFSEEGVNGWVMVGHPF